MQEQRIVAEMRQEGLDAVEDTLERLYETFAGLSDADDAAVFKKDVHNLKGLGAAFGFPGLSHMAHLLEDYMAGQAGFDNQALAGVQQFLDRMAELAEERIEASVDELKSLLRGLPGEASSSTTFNPDDVKVTEVSVLLVAPADIARRYVANELRECGYRVSAVADPLAGVQRALQTRPDLIVVAAVLDRLGGVDLVCALRAMPSTRDFPVALMTSLDPGDSKLRELPTDVPILGKGANFSDDVASALSTLGLT